ncbi:oxaloacetate decarboxylase [Paraburkholderia sp. BCC1886]|uniref:isocitrate lyase/PEP mutase family protein n=1 Tax=Paraburkholderia sp. BCC1886 TaxID=2562670 RepID=UPI001182FBEF|nr:isocitrate lyase/PEP mutase family protein [Paraburkholderia sp. BCC1886]
MTAAATLRALLAQPDIVIAPGAYDGFTARLVERAGFPAVYMTGAGTSARYGLPDYGLLTMTEMVGNATTLADAVSIPVIADADTGYGTELNVVRTVRHYERSGAAAIHIEDQVAPKRCGHLEGKEIVSREEFVAKIRAAVFARRDPDFLIIARTDSRAVRDLDEAIARANLALEAGADMAFVEAVQSLDELAAVPQRVHGPCLLNVVRGGKTPNIDLRTANELGYRLAILPSLLIGEIADACMRALGQLKATGQPPALADGPTLQERFRQLGASEWDDMRTRFRSATLQTAGSE